MIKETEWIRIPNTLATVKYVYACKGSQCFVVAINKGLSADTLNPTGETEIKYRPIKSLTFEEAKEKVQRWLDKQ